MRWLVDSFGQVLGAMWAHKLRSFLTMFGIAWGVGSLLLLVGLGEGFRAGTEKNLASFGDDYMQMYNGRVPAIGGIWLLVLLCMQGAPGPNRFGASSTPAIATA